jgi:hypothetical protein
MILLLDATYPGAKTVEVATTFLKYLQDNPLPDYVKLNESYAVAGKDGIWALLFYNIEDAKSKEGTDYVAKAALYFLKNIEGYKAYTKIIYPLAEAFSLIDMQGPAL